MVSDIKSRLIWPTSVTGKFNKFNTTDQLYVGLVLLQQYAELLN